ncbi:IS701 family transposase, partial [Streptomyces sp. URMC 125]
DAYHPVRSRDPITLTVPEIRHLLVAAFGPPALSTARLLHWSNRRRHRQATARHSHYRRRSIHEPAG